MWWRVLSSAKAARGEDLRVEEPVHSGNWLQALKRSVIADNGKELVMPYPFAYLKAKGIGVSKAVKTVVLCARLQAWSRGMRRQQW
jgi:hypothetical protein